MLWPQRQKNRRVRHSRWTVANCKRVTEQKPLLSWPWSPKMPHSAISTEKGQNWIIPCLCAEGRLMYRAWSRSTSCHGGMRVYSQSCKLNQRRRYGIGIRLSYYRQILRTHIFSFPMHISLRSLTWASMSKDLTAFKITWAVAYLSNEVRGRWMEKLVLPRSCKVHKSMPNLPVGWKCTYMINGTTSTSSAYERNSSSLGSCYVDLFPRILIAPYDHTRFIAIY